MLSVQIKDNLLVELIKTFIALTRKVSKVVFKYCQPIAMCLIGMMNNKYSEEIKKYTLICFNELVKNCSYVIIPYFHFPTLRYTII